MSKRTFSVISVFAAICLVVDSTGLQKRGFRLCGDRLTEALHMICGGSFYGPGQEYKRDATEEGTVLDFEQPADGLRADLFPGWFLARLASKSNENSLYPNISRRQLPLMGVANECCTRHCSYSDLAAYCAK